MPVNDERSFRIIGKIIRIKVFFFFFRYRDVDAFSIKERKVLKEEIVTVDRISLDRVNFNSGSESLTLLSTFNITSSREFLFNPTLVTIFNLLSRIRSIQ